MQRCISNHLKIFGWRHSRTTFIIWKPGGMSFCYIMKCMYIVTNRLCSSCGCTRRTLCFHVAANSASWSKAARVPIDLRSGHIIKPRPTRFASVKANECRWRPRRYHVDLMWCETLPTASLVLLPNRKKRKCQQRWDNASFLHTRGETIWYRSPARRPKPITCSEGNIVPRGSVGAPNKSAPFRIIDAVVGFVDRWQSTTLILAIRTFEWVLSGRFETKIWYSVISFRLFF